MMQRFPWGEVMRLGIGTYHISPREFWACTLRELIFIRGNAGFGQELMTQLMQQYPD